MILNFLFEIQSIHEKDLFVQKHFQIQFKKCSSINDENSNCVMLHIEQDEYIIHNCFDDRIQNVRYTNKIYH